MKLGYDFDVKDNYMVRSAKWLGEMAETDRGKSTLHTSALGNYYWHSIDCYKQPVEAWQEVSQASTGRHCT